MRTRTPSQGLMSWWNGGSEFDCPATKTPPTLMARSSRVRLSPPVQEVFRLVLVAARIFAFSFKRLLCILEALGKGFVRR